VVLVVLVVLVGSLWLQRAAHAVHARLGWAMLPQA
jgi:hypothetical protein